MLYSVVLGGAGLIAALTLKRRLPQLAVRLPEIGRLSAARDGIAPRPVDFRRVFLDVTGELARLARQRRRFSSGRNRPLPAGAVAHRR